MRYLITGSRDKTTKVWDLETSELASCFLHLIYNLIFSQMNSFRDSFVVVDSLKCTNGYTHSDSDEIYLISLIIRHEFNATYASILLNCSPREQSTKH